MSDVLGRPEDEGRRLAAKANYERDVTFAVHRRSAPVSRAAIVQGNAMVIPTLHAREGDTIYLHAVLRTR